MSEIPIDDPQRRRLPPLLRRAWYSLNQAFRRRIAHTNCTPDQYTVMRILTEGGTEGITQRDLAARMSSDPNTVSSLVRRMEKAGLLHLNSNPSDRRAHLIQPTPAGAKRFVELRAIAQELQGEVLEALPAERREEILGALEVLANACRDIADRSAKKDK